MADDSWKKVGYTVEEYINFYKEAFQYIMELNKMVHFLLKRMRHIFCVRYLKIILKIIWNYVRLVALH